MKQTTDFQDLDDMVSSHRKVLKSLIEQDGVYRAGQAVEINNGFGKQLAVLKLKLEAFKLMKHTPTRKDLFLSEKTKK